MRYNLTNFSPIPNFLSYGIKHIVQLNLPSR